MPPPRREDLASRLGHKGASVRRPRRFSIRRLIPGNCSLAQEGGNSTALGVSGANVRLRMADVVKRSGSLRLLGLISFDGHDTARESKAIPHAGSDSLSL